MITICLTYFKSLTPVNLAAALYSVRKQDLRGVQELVVFDNDTVDRPELIEGLIDDLEFPIPTRLLSIKHGDPLRTHAWSTNAVVNQIATPWVLFTRADYLLDFTLLDRFIRVIEPRHRDWNGFITGHVYHLNADIGQCELTGWRTQGLGALKLLAGVENDYTSIDSGVWFMPTRMFRAVGGLNEDLTAWGHAQTHFQHKLFLQGVEFVRIPEALFYHPRHAAPRDIVVAHRQLQDTGTNLKDMWARYHGASPY